MAGSRAYTVLQSEGGGRYSTNLHYTAVEMICCVMCKMTWHQKKAAGVSLGYKLRGIILNMEEEQSGCNIGYTMLKN